MSEGYICMTEGNLKGEHLCCAIADKKHQHGVEAKKKPGLRNASGEGHVFEKTQ